MDADIRKQRMHRLIDLARMTHGWSMDQLAEALDRRPADVYPESDNPGTQFFMKLAGVLEWRVGDVIEVIWGDQSEQTPPTGDRPDEAHWSDLYDQWVETHRAGGRNQELVRIARDMRYIADTPARRALTCALEGIGWDALGRYVEAVDIFRQGLQLTPIPGSLRRNLQGNLASAMYSLWDLFPALAMADSLIRWYDIHPPRETPDRKRQAFVHYVRGNTHRRMMRHHPENADTHALQAHRDLLTSADLHRALARELDESRLAGIAHTCEGGLLEVDVELGRRSPEEALACFEERLRSADDSHAHVGDWIESFGWWAIFACNVSQRHLAGDELREKVEQFATRAMTFADLQDNWSIRERAYSIRYAVRETAPMSDHVSPDHLIDEIDQALIAAMISRFPTFRSVGWKILDSANAAHGR